MLTAAVFLQDGWTYLMHAAKQNCLAMVNLMLKAGAEVHAVNKVLSTKDILCFAGYFVLFYNFYQDGCTALDIIADSRAADASTVVSLLLIAGAASSASNKTLLLIIDRLPLISDRCLKEMVRYIYMAQHLM